MNIFRNKSWMAIAAILGVLSAPVAVGANAASTASAAPAVVTATTGVSSLANPQFNSDPTLNGGKNGGDGLAVAVQNPDLPNYNQLQVVAGLFAHTINPDGTKTTTTNVAVASQKTNKVVGKFAVAGTARAAAFCDNREIFVGGDITTAEGQARRYLAKYVTKDDINWTLDPTWKPPTSVTPGRIKAIACSTALGRIFVTGETQGVSAVNNTTGAPDTAWATNGKYTFQGAQGRTLKVVGDDLFVGGSFAVSVGGTATRGALKLSVLTGALDTNFKVTTVLVGETIVSMDWDPTHNQMIMGGAGTGHNSLRAFDANTGWQNWGKDNGLYGDAQGVAVVTYPDMPGFSIVIAGFHWNKTANPPIASKPLCDYYAGFDAGSGNLITQNGTCAGWWDLRLEGAVAGNPSLGNGGVQGIVFDKFTGHIIMVGAFRKVNGAVQAGWAMFDRPPVPDGVGSTPTPTPTPTETPTSPPTSDPTTEPTTCPVPA